VTAQFDPGTGLGPRLRLVREGQQLSVRELARRVGCSASLISQVERGLSVPSVGVLYSLASELRSSLDYLLFGADQRNGAGAAVLRAPEPVAAVDVAPVDVAPADVAPADVAPGVAPVAAAPGGVASAGAVFPDSGALARRPGIVQRADSRRIIDLASGVRWERLTPASDSRTDFLEVIYSPGGHSTDERRPLRHEGHEYGLIISGTLQANVGFETYELGPGDSIAFDSSTPHEYWNKTDDYVHAIWVVVHSEPGRA
jgi:mannose-6-phosphate isomerase-like protein (cupin superfamily)/DNA-binding XRE family transcriptional regulator